MKWRYSDGGRSIYYKDVRVSDCVCRAISIAENKDYNEVYNMIKTYANDYKENIDKEDNSHPRYGVTKPLINKILTDLGYKWIPTMKFGQGCKVHLKDGELPKKGTYIVSVSKHLTTLKDNIVYDTYDPCRNGKRCVYGYYVKS